MKRCHSTSGDYRDICHVKGPARRQRGVALILTAVCLLVLIGVVGLSVDWGKTAINVHQLNNAADAGALAGAMIVKARPTDAIVLASATAGLNETDRLPVSLRTTMQPDPFDGNEADLDILLGRWVLYNRTFVATLDAPNAVRTIARRMDRLGDDAPPLALVFGPVFKTSTVDAVREAVAWCNDSGGSGLICLDSEYRPGLLVSGTGDLDIEGGGIHVNSIYFGKNNKAGAQIQGGGLIDCGFINVVGGIDPEPSSDDWLSIFEGGDEGEEGFSVVDGTIQEVPHLDDPLAARMLEDGDPYVAYPGDHLDLPALLQLPGNEGGVFPVRTQTVEGTAITGPVGFTCTLAPGYYPYGLRLTTLGITVTLDPKADTTVPPIYIFGGSAGPASGLYVNGGNLIGEGVTCYVTKSYGYDETYGVTELTGNGTIRLISPGDLERQTNPNADVDGLQGIAIWQDPANTNVAHLNGGGDLSIAGTLYFPNPIHLRLEGNLGQTGNQILCGSVELHGQAVVNVNYDRRNDFGHSNRSMLVR